MLSEEPIYGSNGSFGSPEKKFSSNFSCFSLHYNHDNSYFLVNGKETFKFKASNKNVNFPTQFCLGSLFNEFGATDSRELSLKGNVYGFSVDYNAIDKSAILNNSKCSMVKNNIK